MAIVVCCNTSVLLLECTMNQSICIRSNKIVLQCACKGYAHYYLLFTLGRDEVGDTNKSEHMVAVEQTLATYT